MGYEVFSQFYDAAMRDYSWCSSFFDRALPLPAPDRESSVLELGCGTGRVLELLSGRFTELYGIDESAPMLSFAHQRLPQARLFRMDIAAFRFDRTFDAVICVFDTINHLSHLSQWRSLFRAAGNHLKRGGVFLLDMNTPKRLQRLAVLPPFLTELDDGSTVIMNIDEQEASRFRFGVRIYEHLGDELFRRHRDTIHEYTPDPYLVLSDLKNEFAAVDVYNEEGDPVVGDEEFARSTDGRLFFACSAP